MSKRLRGSKVMRQGGVDTLIIEEPDDRIGHVRICGGDGQQWLSLPGKGVMILCIDGHRRLSQPLSPTQVAFLRALQISESCFTHTPRAL